MKKTVTLVKETDLTNRILFMIRINGDSIYCGNNLTEALKMFDIICDNIIKFNGISKTEIIKTIKI